SLNLFRNRTFSLGLGGSFAGRIGSGMLPFMTLRQWKVLSMKHRIALLLVLTSLSASALAAAGRQLAQREAQRLQRDEYWLRPWREESAPLPAVA
ncbi:hypothetical protein FK514_28650, partial [Klebsiella pneumoniae]|uniref:tRNA-binding protein n=1 Tax=Klebsiella pneumoniae TaxID=573 RepID=UPI00210CD17C